MAGEPMGLMPFAVELIDALPIKQILNYSQLHSQAFTPSSASTHFYI